MTSVDIQTWRQSTDIQLIFIYIDIDIVSFLVLIFFSFAAFLVFFSFKSPYSSLQLVDIALDYSQNSVKFHAYYHLSYVFPINNRTITNIYKNKLFVCYVCYARLYLLYIYKNKLYAFLCWGFAYDVWKIKKKEKTN